GIKHAVLVGYLSRRLGFPVRLVEDRLENMRGGDGHGPERNFDIEVAFDDSGVIRSMKMRALDNVGAYAGRSPFQLGKPIDKVIARANYAGLLAERDRLRRQGLLAGIGIAACLEPSGANSTFEPLLNPKNETTTYSDSCRINVDLSGAVTATIHTLSAGQG